MQNGVCVPSICSFSQNRPERMTTPRWRPCIYSQIPVLIRRSPANYTVPRRQNGATLSPVPHHPRTKAERQKKTIKLALRPSLVHSAEPMLCRAFQPRSYLLSRCPDMDWVVVGAAASALWRLAWPPSPGARSPNRRVALNNWGTRPQPERMYVWPLALKHPLRGICAGLCSAA